MNNKGILPVVLIFYILWSTLGAVCLWHIPAWTKAKALENDKITGNAGNFVQGNSK